ncbi:hypothetical protein BGZ88_002242 [Linnemannia elongata]|nr:hypothetical protein BGZ88_002242 [Linnemannia elongata]
MRQSFLVPLVVVALKFTHAASTPYEDKVVSGHVSVGVGSPPTMYTLLINTGTSNTWIGANTSYVPTAASQKTVDSVSVSYGAGNFSGTEYTDTVTLGSGVAILRQSIGVATKSTGFADVDGVLGLGPVGLTVGTLSPDSSSLIPTITDNLFSKGTIKAHQIGIGRNSITFGEIDASEIVGALEYVKITTTSPASEHWGIDTSFVYGDDMAILALTAGIVDHGTTLLLLATDAFQKFQSATGGVPDAATRLLKITADQYATLKPLNFNVHGNTFTITPNALIWPREHNKAIGGDPGGIYLVVSDIGHPSGQGLDFIIGYRVLQRFYTVFDIANSRVGFAKTTYTDSTEN